MAELKWVRIVTNIFENPKLIQIDAEESHDEIIVIWFKLICLAGKCNNDGLLTIAGRPYTVKMLSVAMNRSLESVKKAISIFKEYNMIEETNGIISILNWSKHQSTDKIEKLNERQREYMKKYRAKQKALCNANGNANGESNVSSAEDRSKKKEERVLKEYIEKKSNDVANAPAPTISIKSFIKPSLQDVKDYCIERKNSVNAEKWLNHYESNGWMVGKTHMKNWKAAVRTWEDGNESAKGSSSKNEMKPGEIVHGTVL